MTSTIRPVHLFRTIGSLSLLCLPLLAHAEDIEIWNFQNGNMPETVSVQQLTSVQQTTAGLAITTSTDGFVVWRDYPLPGPADVITLRVRSTQPAEAAILWPANPAKPDELLQLFFVMEPSNDFRDIDVVMSNFSEWDWRTEIFGIAFPAGTSVTIEQITFRHWAWSERLVEGWKSFWTIDEFRPYSINFLWGPLIATNKASRIKLYDSLPPVAWSAVRLLYGFIIASVLAAAVTFFMSGDKQKGRAHALVIIATTCVASWLVFDLRMGIELLTYAKRDIASYVLPPEHQKILRTHSNFYSVARSFLPEITRHERYAFITQQDTPFFANLRYMAYPSVPVTDPAQMSGSTLYVVIGRPDVSLTADNRLSDANGAVLSPAGRILQRSGNDSFLFLVNQ